MVQIWSIFLGKRSFFLVESKFSRLLLDIRQMFFEFWEQIVKIVGLIAQINFSWKNFIPEKNVQFDSIFQNGGRGIRV